MLARAGVNIPVYYSDNLFKVQTAIPGLSDDVIVFLQNMTRKLTPEELEQLKISAQEQKNRAIQQRDEVVNELEERINVPLPQEFRDTTILNW